VQDLQGWWATLVFSGLSTSIGVLVLMLLRERNRRREERERRMRRLIEEYKSDHENEDGG